MAVLLLLLGVLGGALGFPEDHLRQLNQAAPITCNNTQAGRWYVADDKGMVCPRTGLDYTTGCCREGELHSCTTCHESDKCCSQYEFCVSCCMKPAHNPEQHLNSIFRGRNKPETGHWSTAFEYCQAVCRTTARSTQHENAFIEDRKHCFSKLGRPRVPVPPAPPLPADITLLPGGSGQSCEDACKAKQLACKAEHFASINDCNSLRSKFMCEAGCGPAAPDQKEFPGYIEGSAPKHQKPAFCSTLVPFKGQAKPDYNCSTRNGSVRRLCPCGPQPPVQVAAAGAQEAAGGAQQQQQPAGAQQAVAADQAAQQAQQQQPQQALQLGEQQQQQQQPQGATVS